MAALSSENPSPQELLEAAESEAATSFPWASAELELDAKSHFWQKPSVTYQRYIVVNKTKLEGIRTGREVDSALVSNGAATLKKGTIVESDHESWAIKTPDLRVHLIILMKGGEAEGWYGGWVSFRGLAPCDADGNRFEPPATLTLETARTIQRNFERGFKQVSVQRAIAEVRAAHPGTNPFREHVDEIWMKVRAPAISRLGFGQTTKDWNAWNARPHDYDVEGQRADGSVGENPMTKEENEGLMKNHNRIVALMRGSDPASAGTEDAQEDDGNPTSYAMQMPSFDF